MFQFIHPTQRCSFQINSILVQFMQFICFCNLEHCSDKHQILLIHLRWVNRLMDCWLFLTLKWKQQFHCPYFLLAIRASKCRTKLRNLIYQATTQKRREKTPKHTQKSPTTTTIFPPTPQKTQQNKTKPTIKKKKLPFSECWGMCTAQGATWVLLELLSAPEPGCNNSRNSPQTIRT